MTDLGDVTRLAYTAQQQADKEQAVFLVCWDGAGAHVVRARDYEAARHGAVERVRYPDRYVHPPLTSNRLW